MTTAQWRAEIQAALDRARQELAGFDTPADDLFALFRVDLPLASGDLVWAFDEDGKELALRPYASPELEGNVAFQCAAVDSKLDGGPAFQGRGGVRLNRSFYAGMLGAIATHALTRKHPTAAQRQRWLGRVRRALAALDEPDPADRAIARKRGKAARIADGILAAACQILEKERELTAKQAWDRIPSVDADEPAMTVTLGCEQKPAQYDVYRFIVDKETREEHVAQAAGPKPDRDIGFDTWRDYVTRARKQLRRY